MNKKLKEELDNELAMTALTGEYINTILYKDFVDANNILCIACSQGHVGIVKFALDNGANIDIHDGYPLFVSTTGGSIKVVKLLVSRGVNVNNVLRSLYWADVGGYDEIAQILQEAGAIF